MIKKLNCQMMSNYSHAVSLELKMRTFGALLQVEFTFFVLGFFFFFCNIYKLFPEHEIFLCIISLLSVWFVESN